MVIQENSRQVPKITIFTANKMYHDLVYGLFQELSYIEKLPGESKPDRYVNKKEVTQTAVSKKLNISRVTAKKYLDNLIALGLVQEDNKNKRYKLIELDKSTASLIPFETLRILNNTLSQNSISIYVYLMNRFIANGCKSFNVTNSQLKNFIGISTDTSSNDHVVSDILKVLELLGLIEIQIRFEEGKSLRFVTRVNNTLKSV